MLQDSYAEVLDEAPGDAALTRKRPWRLLVIMLVAAIIIFPLYIGAQYVESRPLQIRIDPGSQSALTEKEIVEIKRQISEWLAGRGFLTVDIKDVHRRLEAQSWLRTASVRKLWPRTIEVEVWLEVPAAISADGFLLDRQGRVIDVLTAGNAVLPEITAKQVEYADALRLFRMQEKVLRESVGPVKSLQFADQKTEITYMNGVVIVLGDQDDWKSSLSRVRSFFAVELNSASVIDARYPNGVAVRGNT